MGSNEPKISFGVKAKPKTLLGISPASSVTLKAKEAKERIEFLEGNLIKTSGKQEEQRSTFLVIPPLKNERSTERTAKISIIQQLKQQRLGDGATLRSTNSMLNDGIETLDQRAAREIVEQTAEAITKIEDSSSIVVPLRPEELPLDGARESTLNDYESVPIEQFGQGMLRGMGWKGEVKKDTEKLTLGPEPRPKGLGLGADRSIKGGVGPGTVPLAQGESLVMKCGAPVKIIAGKHKGKYATIKSIDEDNGRVIVELSIGKQLESLNECFVQLVSVGEYCKNSNVINTAKYEQFKERELNSASAGSSKDTRVEKTYSKHSSYRDSDNTNSSEDERERHRRKHKKSSSPYIRTSSGTKKKSHKYKQRREYRDERRGSSRDRRHRSPRASGSESDDKFHKKKTKKKKRPRSRSRSRQ
ncbi:G-patch domain and KOW motifs-containing protein [Anopheles marshallii]|uniref:G-patch domain and KOW motifs-containing protein n=1 Tax=Anopheles marshallii TaxID=1521116 RepID=UPI00237B4BFE|nr:G-patch domain and KOW motifs-containing protein [Anopheles marshallii]